MILRLIKGVFIHDASCGACRYVGFFFSSLWLTTTKGNMASVVSILYVRRKDPQDSGWKVTISMTAKSKEMYLYIKTQVNILAWKVNTF
jgi:hypothetical protein